MLKSINPADESVVGEVINSREKEVSEVVSKAKSAFNSWKNTTYEERGKLMQKVIDLMNERKDQLGELVTKEMGKPIDSGIGEISGEAGDDKYMIDNVKKWLIDDSIVVGDTTTENKITFEPVGVVAAITPWNYPFSIPMGQTVPSILAGNTIIIKPSEYTPLIAVEIARLFKDAGFPEGVVNIVTGDKETGKLLVESNIDVITLTGSVTAGKHVAEKAGSKLKRVVLELGGSDPFIVCSDANLERAVNAAVWGRYNNCGQICCSSKRFYIHEGVYDEFLKKFIEKTKILKVGDPMNKETQIGPLVSDIQLSRLEEQLKRAVESGAKLLLGGKRIGDTGFFFQPTVLEVTDNKNPAMQEEVFGPIATIMKVRNCDEAIKFANDSQYGLAGSVWTEDKEKAQKIAKALQTGTVWINYTLGYNCECPWGGVKNSGIGVINSKYGIMDLVNIKRIETSKSNKTKEDFWF